MLGKSRRSQRSLSQLARGQFKRRNCSRSLFRLRSGPVADLKMGFWPLAAARWASPRRCRQACHTGLTFRTEPQFSQSSSQSFRTGHPPAGHPKRQCFRMGSTLTRGWAIGFRTGYVTDAPTSQVVTRKPSALSGVFSIGQVVRCLATWPEVDGFRMLGFRALGCHPLQPRPLYPLWCLVRCFCSSAPRWGCQI
jgi:hypothetical protein